MKKDMEFHYKIGEHLRAERKRSGYTQFELAEDAGISINALGHYERGEKSMTINNLNLILNVLGLPLSEFFENCGY